ncbi:hypothetical protein VTK26DRAFT_5324 [Humicola hyalothermophila]
MLWPSVALPQRVMAHLLCPAGPQLDDELCQRLASAVWSVNMADPTGIRGGTAPLASLTSVFTLPCPTSWLLTTTRLLSQYPAFPTTGPASCDPPSWSANIAGAGFHFYSPAICPRGFVVGPSCGITKTRTAEGFPGVLPGETAVYCVPIGLTCTTDVTDFRGGVWGFARDATTRDATVTVGPAIQIRWVEADLTLFETHPLTPGLTLAGTEPEVRTVTTSAQSPPPLPSTSSRPPILASTTTTNSAEAMETATSAPESQPSPEADQSSRLPTTLITDTRTRNLDETMSIIFETADPTDRSYNPVNTAAANQDTGGLGSLSRGASIVVIVVSTVVAGILLWTAAFLLIRRYKKRAMQRRHAGRKSFGSGFEGGHRYTKAHPPLPHAAVVSPGGVSELEAGSPAIGTTPNPAELEGDFYIQPPAKPWMNRSSYLKPPPVDPPKYSPSSIESTQSSACRTIRESFGEKINDPAAAIGRLRLPNPLAAITRSSASPASPRGGGGSFWRLPRSPRSPSTAGRLSAQLPKPSPKSGLSGGVSGPNTPGDKQ